MDAQWFEIVKILLDKLLIGGIVAFAAYRGASILDANRSRQALQVELSKRGADSVAAAWSTLAKYELSVRRLAGTQITKQDYEGKPDTTPAVLQFVLDDLTAARKESLELQTEVIVSISATRFWMGRDIYDDLNLLLDKVHALHRIAIDNTYESEAFWKAEKELKAFKQKLSLEQALLHAGRLGTAPRGPSSEQG